MFHTPGDDCILGVNSVDPWECHLFLCLNVCFRHLAHMGAMWDENSTAILTAILGFLTASPSLERWSSLDDDDEVSG